MEASKTAAEGPRSFSVFATQICDGELEAEASLTQQQLLAALEEEATTRGKCKGRLTLTIEYEVDNKGNCTVGFDVAKKEPKKMRGAGRCWLTKGSNYSMEPPAKKKSLREVERNDVETPTLQAPAKGGTRSL